MEKITSYLNLLKKGNIDFSTILKGGLLTLLSKISVVIAGLIVNFLVARFYGASTVGIISIITTIVSMFSMLALMGLNISVLKLIPARLAEGLPLSAASIYRKGLGIISLASLAVGLLLCVFSDTLAHNYFHNQAYQFYIFLAGIFLVTNVWFEYNSSTLRAIGKIREAAWYTTISNAFKPIIILIICFLGLADSIIVIAFLFFYALSSLPLFGPVLRFFRAGDHQIANDQNTASGTDSVKEILRLSFPMLVTASATLTISYMDFLMLGYYVPEAQIGYYTISTKLAQATVFILASVNAVSAPKFAELFQQKKNEALRQLVVKTTRMILLLSLPVTVILIVFGNQILQVFGTDFVSGYVALVLLALAKIVSAACGSVGYLLNMTNHQKVYRNIILISCCINISLNLILIPEWGINGAAFATMVSIIFNNIVALIYIKLKFGYWTF